MMKTERERNKLHLAHARKKYAYAIGMLNLEYAEKKLAGAPIQEVERIEKAVDKLIKDWFKEVEKYGSNR